MFMSVRRCAVGPSEMPGEEPGVDPTIRGHLVMSAWEGVQHLFFRGEGVEQIETGFAGMQTLFRHVGIDTLTAAA